MECPACRSPIPAESAFCGGCGRAVASSAAGSTDTLQASLAAQIGGQYRIERLLGRGGMGAVYLAQDSLLDRPVAIKVLPPDHGDAEQSRARFRREARTAARLTHPNIVPLYSFGEAAGTMYFVMGYVRGETLSSRMRRTGAFPVATAVRILSQLAEALDYAHRNGVVHRDVKPDNVLIDDDTGRALLTDFGIAKAIDAASSLTTEGLIVGTPQYMSPEQAAAKPGLDARSDIYSLGVLGWALLVGRLPFEGSVTEILTQHMTRPAPSLASVAPQVPSHVVAAVMRCLAKSPADRFATAREFMDAIAVSDDALPEALGAVEGVGLGLSLMAFGWVLFGVKMYADMTENFPWEVYLPATLLWPVIFFLHCRPVVKKGFSWRDVLQAAFIEPRFWPTWYPRPLRRPAAARVWSRLPRRIRYARTMLLVAMVVMGFAITTIFLITDSPRFGSFEDSPLRGPLRAVGMLEAIPVIGVLILSHLEQRRLTGSGLDAHDASQVIFGTPLSRTSFGSQPHIAAILLPESGAPGAEPRTAEDYAGAVQQAAREMPAPLQPVAAEAANAATSLLRSIGELDAELKQLRGDADPAEIARLEQRLSAAPGGEMATLLQRQLDILRTLRQRALDLESTRSRRLELLKVLWLSFAQARADALQDATRRQQISAHVSRVSAELTQGGGSLAPEAADLPTLDQTHRHFLPRS